MQDYQDMSSENAFVEGKDASAEAFFIDALLHRQAAENGFWLHACSRSRSSS